MKQNCIIFVEASMTGAGEVACAHAKEMGLTVVLMSCKPDLYFARILKHCDIAIVVDTTSTSALVAHATDIASNLAIFMLSRLRNSLSTSAYRTTIQTW